MPNSRMKANVRYVRKREPSSLNKGIMAGFHTITKCYSHWPIDLLRAKVQNYSVWKNVFASLFMYAGDWFSVWKQNDTVHRTNQTYMKKIGMYFCDTPSVVWVWFLPLLRCRRHCMVIAYRVGLLWKVLQSSQASPLGRILRKCFRS